MINPKHIPAIIGCDPYRDRDDIMRLMVRDHLGLPSEFKSNPVTKWAKGNIANATMDYELSFENEGGDILQIYCPYPQRDKEEPVFKSITDESMQHHLAALNYRMHVEGAGNASFFQWAPRGAMHEVVVFDPAWWNNYAAVCDDFTKELQEYLSGRKDCTSFAEPKRKVINSEHATRLVDEYDDLKESIDNANERAADILAELAELAGQDAEINGRNLTLVQRKGGVQYAKALKHFAPDADLSDFTGEPSSYWRLS